VERWRTRALLGALVLIAAGGVAAVVLAQTDNSTKRAARPQISASSQSPLTIDGTGFRSNERVRIVVDGGGAEAWENTHASRRGRFRVVLNGVKGCDSLTVSAAGSKGSRASLNVSSYVCP
jgi:hypothetical protein